MHTRLLLLALALSAGCNRAPSGPTLYCAQDREFAELVLAKFAEVKQIQVTPRFDTEANKSVALIEELLREKDRPRCDVHWNNEILGTIRLQRAGVLAEYASPSAEPYPAWSKAKDGTWQAFASRARVIIVNTDKLPADRHPKSLFDLAKPEYRAQVAMAKPLFGTTATQAACLFAVLGADVAGKWYRDLKANGVQIVAGNKQVAEGVGRGDFALGTTDTDDAIAEVRAGRPVSIIFPDAAGHAEHPNMGTLYIPNTLALIRGCRNPDAAKHLIDYLLSAESEKLLAETASAQIPLNPNVKATLPPSIRTPSDVRAMQVDFERAADMWEQSQRLMRELFSGG